MPPLSICSLPVPDIAGVLDNGVAALLIDNARATKEIRVHQTAGQGLAEGLVNGIVDTRHAFQLEGSLQVLTSFGTRGRRSQTGSPSVPGAREDSPSTEWRSSVSQSRKYSGLVQDAKLLARHQSLPPWGAAFYPPLLFARTQVHSSSWLEHACAVSAVYFGRRGCIQSSGRRSRGPSCRRSPSERSMALTSDFACSGIPIAVSAERTIKGRR